MLLIKVSHKKETRYYKYVDEDFISIRKDKRIRIPLNGDIEFNYINKKWTVTNKCDIKLKYGFGRISPNKSKILKYNKPIKYKDYQIVSIEYKERQVRKISPGLAHSQIDLSLKTEYIIGRDPSCDIVVDNPQIDNKNTRIIHDGDVYYIEDLSSANGLYINGKKYKNKILANYDTISIPGAVYMLLGNTLLQSSSTNGVRIDARHIFKRVKDFDTHKHIYLINDVNLTIYEGEYVAIVGGSGAGKSTFLDCINGRRPMTSGYVYYDMNNYYEYFNSYQKLVGYVPQSDIMHTGLSVYKTLYYYAQIRMQHHLTKKELRELVLKTLDEVSLKDKKDVVVSSLSGGQRKRVNIAMELLANPKVIFLDEPTSGLSPDLDYEIMSLLAELKKKGKTIIIITHNMENVDKCDKIAFLGKGGKLCYYGKPEDIFKFFGCKKYGEIFCLLSDSKNVTKYENKFKQTKEYRLIMDEQDRLYLGGERR